MKLKDFFHYWVPLILYMAFMFYLSSLSYPLKDSGILEFSFRDKIFHLIEYFILSFLIFRLLNFYRIKKKYLYAIILTTLYGISDEFHQFFVIGRYCSFFDMLANFLGSLLILFRKLVKKS